MPRAFGVIYAIERKLQDKMFSSASLLLVLLLCAAPPPRLSSLSHGTRSRAAAGMRLRRGHAAQGGRSAAGRCRLRSHRQCRGLRVERHLLLLPYSTRI